MINTYLQPFIEYFNNGEFFANQFAVAGILSAAFYTIISYLKPIPSFIWSRIKRQFVYTLTVEQSSELYVLLSQYIAENHPNKLRNVEAFLEDTYGANSTSLSEEDVEDVEDESNENKKIKYRHYSDFVIIRRGLNLIKIEKEREKLENAKDFTKAYMGRVRVSGFFAKRIINKLLEDALALKPEKDSGAIKRYVWDGYWSSRYVYTNKTSDKIFFPEKNGILKRVDIFSESKKFYQQRGIEWYLGILLHGKPGSGKSSFATSLADYTNRDLYTLNLSSLTDSEFQKCFSNIGKNAILVLDDIDVGINGRKDKSGIGIKLSTLLSSLDGTESRSDLIVVMTTNNKSALDDALIRKGRIDIIEEVSYPNRTSVCEYLANFYNIPNVQVEEKITRIEFNSSMVNIQDICLRNLHCINTAAAEINSI